jgi:hypothetical protein
LDTRVDRVTGGRSEDGVLPAETSGLVSMPTEDVLSRVVVTHGVWIYQFEFKIF